MDQDTALLTVTLMGLEGLAKDSPVDFYELVCLARDRNHSVFGGENGMPNALRAKLVSKSTSGGFVIHSMIREIIQDHVEGEGFEMKIVNI